MFQDSKICAVVAESRAQDALAAARLALRRTSVIELRLDYLASEDEFAVLLRGIMPLAARATLIATCRRKEAGGRFDGSIARQISRLVLAAGSGCAWCDLEIETVGRLNSATLRKTLGDVRLIISSHDFTRTPARLGELRRRLESAGGDVVKIAALTRHYRELVRLLRTAHSRRNVIVVPMGDVGLPGRIAAVREGSALAYASAGTPVAPGQLSLEAMQSVYRVERQNRRTQLYGIIGNPVGHSLSPLLHNAGFAHRHVNAVFVPFLVRDLPDFMKSLRPLRISGLSVTIPHKQQVLRYLDECDPLAAEVGAVNTIVSRAGQLHGYNTDHLGVMQSLGRRMKLDGARVLIYGVGGAGRTVGFAAARAGAQVFFCARRTEAARNAARDFGAEAVERKDLREMEFDAIVNATPIGMMPNADASPLEPAELRCGLVFDLIYRPLRTRLLRLAERRGIATLSGVEMFVAQGVAQWELWTGEKAPVAAMRAEVTAALARDESRSQSPARREVS
ncbi:MAG TPA: shikimate dehydrogenase [Candidatus Acidoferrales bacterium]|nr:shikimate dehydrogenase [Candidatus Acidoferrales bacterium]